MNPAVPVIKIADYTYPPGGWRPNPEDGAADCVNGGRMGAKFVVDLVMVAVIEEMAVEVGELW